MGIGQGGDTRGPGQKCLENTLKVLYFYIYSGYAPPLNNRPRVVGVAMIRRDMELGWDHIVSGCGGAAPFGACASIVPGWSWLCELQSVSD